MVQDIPNGSKIKRKIIAITIMQTAEEPENYTAKELKELLPNIEDVLDFNEDHEDANRLLTISISPKEGLRRILLFRKEKDRNKWFNLFKTVEKLRQ